VVRHDGQEQTIDFSSDPNGMFGFTFAAFYADCEHEVRPLKKGHRLCLGLQPDAREIKEAISAPAELRNTSKPSVRSSVNGGGRLVEKNGHHAGP